MSDPQAPEFQAPPPPPEQPAPAPRPTKMRPVAIGVFVLGLVLLGLGLAKVLPAGVVAGGFTCLMGIVAFALSFIPLPRVEAPEPPLSAAERVFGIFYEPTRVFRNLRAHPRWVAAFVVIAFMNVLYTTAFVQRLTPERIVNYRVDKLAESGFVPAEAIERSREQQLEQARGLPARITEGVGSVNGTFAKYCFAAALFLLGVIAFGGRINFWQALSALLYASLPVVIVTKVLSLILLYVKSPDDIHPILGAETLVQDNLGALVSPATHPALFVLATAFGLLSFYWIWLMAKGLANTGTKVSSTVGWAVTLTLTILGLGLGMIFATLFASFLS
ncbi:MAG TPA: YIP1 family protein [Pyrinomonadaceae bacterium]|nr:YIP1 family protein [Pyrinomonadaceae bacterium]